MEEFIIMLVIVLGSAASSWFQKRRQESEEETESGTMFPPDTTSGRPVPQEETHGSSGQRTLEEWLGISTTEQSSEEPEPAQTARETAPASQSEPRHRESMGRFETSNQYGEAHPSSPAHHRSQRESRGKAERKQVDESQSRKAAEFKAHAGDPFARSHDDAYARQIESPFDYNRSQAYRLKRSRPYGRKTGKAKNELKAALRGSASARRLFLGSVVLAPPKSLQESHSHYF